MPTTKSITPARITLDSLRLTITREEAKANRAEARAAGFKTFSGKPCRHGHGTERYVSNGQCIECRRALNARWRSENPEAYRESNRRWDAANSDRYAAINGKKHAKERAGAGCIPIDFNLDATIPLYAEARRLTAETGVPHVVDHVLALALGGKHEATNLRVVTATVNREKATLEQQLAQQLRKIADQLDTAA